MSEVVFANSHRPLGRLESPTGNAGGATSLTIGMLARDLRLTGRPQAGARVWSARYDLRDDFPEHAFIGRIGELQVRRRGVEIVGFYVLFTVGYMMYVVIYWPRTMPDELPGEAKSYPSSRFELLWPIYSSESHWPPRHLFLYKDVEELVAGVDAARVG